VKAKLRQQLHARKRKIERRLDKTKFPKGFGPVLRGGNLRYEISDRVHGLGHGGIALMHQLAQDIGLVDAIDKGLSIFKVRFPYSESDHVLNLAFNALCGGECLQDIELRRNDVNRPSHEGAADALERAIVTCLRGGFSNVLLRGDTDFSQTEHLDRWHNTGCIQFIFGYDAMPNLKDLAEELPASAWQKLQRPPKYQAVTSLRHRPDNVKDKIVRERGYETLRLQSEEVAEFTYQPHACQRAYRMIVVRKNISKEKGELRLHDEIRYLFYITNDWTSTPAEIVFCANDRCHQENLLQQLKNGLHALTPPVDNLESNWAYMVMTSLGWSLKAWGALRLPETGRWADKYKAEKLWLLGLEFKAFVHAFVAIPCQIVRQARRLVCRVLSYHQHLHLFFRLADVLRC
jgi:hypothetical protein